MKGIYLQTKWFLLILLVFCGQNLLAQHQERLKISQNEVWKYKQGEVPLAEYARFDDSDWKILNLPHTWNDKDVMDEGDGYYQGVGWYRKHLKTEDSWNNKRIFLYFEGANQVTDLFINGQFVGRHTGGYTAFCYDVTKYLNFGKNNDNIVAVKVDNSIDANIPPLSADFTFYGGIYRDVYLIATNPVHFSMTNDASEGVFWQTPEVSTEKALLKTWGTVINDAVANQKLRIISKVIDAELQTIEMLETKMRIKSGKETKFEQQVTIDNPKLWSPDNPYLYQLVTQIVDDKSGKIIDEVRNPLAFRFFSFDADKGFFINGKHTFLIGVNRHQDYLGIGNALPDELHLQDIRLLKEMGANFIRIAHYPQDKALVEECDRLGLVASIEIPIVNYITETEEFTQNCLNMQREMIRQYYNHPSIIIWAYMNEVMLRRKKFKGTYKEYVNNLTELTQKIEDLTRKEDPYRYTMIPNHQGFQHYHPAKLTRIPMIVGWNLYPGWYGSRFSRLDHFLDNIHRKELPDKPVIITEYGAGADPRLHSFEPQRFDFTIEWQNKYHEYYLDAMKKREFITGGAIWNFVDFNSEGRIDAVPHINNKGIMTRDRKPKDAYLFYQAQLCRQPVINIAPANWAVRSGMPQKQGEQFCTQPMYVYTNQKDAELFHNGKSLGKKTPDNTKITWQVPFVNGTNRFEAITKAADGKNYRDYMEVEFVLHPLNFKSNETPMKDLNINVGSHCYFVDNFNQIWLPDKPYQKGNWGFIKGNVYQRGRKNKITGTNQDIWGTEHDPVFQTQRDSISEYRFDVPKGQYEITLCFAELLSDEKRKQLAYNLNMDQEQQSAGERIFDVLINDELIIEKLNIAEQYGVERSVEKKTQIVVADENGIHIQFSPHKGNAVLNGIRIRKMY